MTRLRQDAPCGSTGSFTPDKDIVESMELDGIIIDYSENREIVAIEIMDAGKRTKKDPLDSIAFSKVKEKALA